MKHSLLIILFVFQLGCHNNNRKNPIVNYQAKDTIKSYSYKQNLESLMDSLILVSDSRNEASLLDKIWSFSNPEMQKHPISLSFSAIDSTGKEVANNLSSAKGDVIVQLSINQKEIGLSKKIKFIPIKKDNLYLLMRE